jgi:hypothetical protein
MGTLCAKASLSGRGATGVPHDVDCANAAAVNSKLLKARMMFVIGTFLSKWLTPKINKVVKAKWGDKLTIKFQKHCGDEASKASFERFDN